MSKQLKQIPKFKSEAEERKFWQKADSIEYVDYAKMENWQFPNLKLTSKPITIRLPQSLIDLLKMKAYQRNIPYQALVKQMLYKSVAEL